MTNDCIDSAQIDYKPKKMYNFKSDGRYSSVCTWIIAISSFCYFIKLLSAD